MRRSPVAAAHTVDLYDFGVTEDQTLYLVMEFLDGMDLDSLVQQHGPMPATLEDLVLACLAKKPEERPRNARQLVQSLDAIDGMTGGEDEAIRWWSKHHPKHVSPSDAITVEQTS